MTEDDHDDELREQYARLRAERSAYVAPQCCAAMSRCKTIVVSFADEEREKPEWLLRLASNYGRYSDESLIEEERRWSGDQRQRAEQYMAGRRWDQLTEIDRATLRDMSPPFCPPPSYCPYCGAALPARSAGDDRGWRATRPRPVRPGPDHRPGRLRARSPGSWPRPPAGQRASALQQPDLALQQLAFKQHLAELGLELLGFQVAGVLGPARQGGFAAGKASRRAKWRVWRP